MKTIPAKESTLEPKWYVVDAKDQILGRFSSKIARIIRGKHKPNFTPHLPTGDAVIVLNAEHIKLTAKKSLEKEYDRYSGYIGGRRTLSFDEMLAKKPEYIIEHAVWGMLPKNKLGRKLIKRLHVYRGDNHPHSAQTPEKLEL